MNETLKTAATDILKGLLAQCTDEQQLIFKRMYSSENIVNLKEESKWAHVPINEVVDNMDEDKLDWAITQCERTVEKNIKGMTDTQRKDYLERMKKK